MIFTFPDRLQFRLRTMFIVVTLLAIPCAYVARQAEIVRQRAAYLPTLDRWNSCVRRNQYFCWPDSEASVPWLRKLLGDQPVTVLAYSPLRDRSGEVINRARQLFPEAVVLPKPRNLKVFNRAAARRQPDDWYKQWYTMKLPGEPGFGVE